MKHEYLLKMTTFKKISNDRGKFELNYDFILIKKGKRPFGLLPFFNLIVLKNIN